MTCISGKLLHSFKPNAKKDLLTAVVPEETWG